MKINYDEIKILVCCHKQVDLPKNELFLPIQVGAAIADNHWGIQRDDESSGIKCDNISDKNQNYCELTAIYWAWKNIKKLYPNIKYVGLCHYRRFFSNINKCLLRINEKTAFIPNFWYTPYSCMDAYKIAHPCVDFEILKNVISEKFPEYTRTFEDILVYNNRNSVYNMFIMPINHFDNYCSWLFDILEEVERRVNIDTYDFYQKRIFGFMSERLLLVYLVHNKINYKNVDVVGPEKQIKLKTFINNVRFNIAYFLGKKRK